MVGILAASVGGYFYFKNQQTLKGDQFCGGFAGIICPENYYCEHEDNYPDASGKCVKTVQENNSSYACPENGWVNCMPILNEAGKKACSPEAMNWYKNNCPNFQGGAL